MVRNKVSDRETVYCSIVTAEYNRIMRSVDKVEQPHERYAIGRRSTKWYHRVFYCLIDDYCQSDTNEYKQKKKQLSFRTNMARQVINGFTSRKRRNKYSFRLKVLFQANFIYLTLVNTFLTIRQYKNRA